MAITCSSLLCAHLFVCGTTVGVSERRLVVEAGYFSEWGDTISQAGLLRRLLRRFPATRYRARALKELYQIADYWLDPVREEMRAARKAREEDRPFKPSTPRERRGRFDPAWPDFDSETEGVLLLQEVLRLDPDGPLTERALFLIGAVAFFREDYPRADTTFSRLVKVRPHGAYFFQALEIAIVSKSLSYDENRPNRRKLVETLLFIRNALRDYPELAQRKERYLSHQLLSTVFRLAEYDFKLVERIDKLGLRWASWWGYEVVRRAYWHTPYAQLATERQQKLYPRRLQHRKGGTRAGR